MVVLCIVEVIVLSSDSEEEELGEDSEECIKDGIRRRFFESVRSLGLPKFGGARGTTEAGDFLARLEAAYGEYKCSPSEGLLMAEYHLEDDAGRWWKATWKVAEERYQGDLWEQFKRAFTDEYSTRSRRPETEEGSSSKEESGKLAREISGMIKVEGHPAYAMFDTGSTHSHVDKEYAKKKGLRLNEFRRKEEITYADGRRTFASMVCEACVIEVGGVRTPAELTVSKIKPLDVLIGMDWLSANHAHIDCRKGEIEFRIPGWSTFKFQGDRAESE